MPDHHLPAVPEREARQPPVCRLLSWTPWTRPNEFLLGHASVAFSGGWQVHHVPVFRTKTGETTVGTPSAADIGADGRIRVDGGGKRVYRPVITFEGAAGRERWSAAILRALADAGITPGIGSDGR